MSGYEQDLGQEYLGRLQGPIAAFVQNYNANPPPACNPTLFFFPGGLGSRLVRATEPAPQGPPFSYYTVWLNCTIVFGVIRELELSGVQDSQDEYILPNGAIDFIQTYDGFIQWCEDSNLPLFIYGWDWRRKSGHAADFFLTKFLPAVNAAVAAGNYARNPLDNFWLIGHSFGGMVVKRILNQTNNSFVQRMKGAITVATPFYGSGGQLHRFFVGETDANATLWPHGAANCTRIVSTLPANYEILFLDLPTFTANQAAFLADPAGYNLTQYPSWDPSTAQTADPYNPVPGPPANPPATGMVRYIQKYNFSWTLLSDGQTAAHLTSQELDPSIAAKFWTVRYVQTDDGGTDVDGTVVDQTWARVDANFDPDSDTDPIADQLGPGDGVVPAWSARLIGLDDGHVVTLHASGLEHQNLMNEGIVQAELASLLHLPAHLMMLAQASAATMKLNAASRDELNAFDQQLREAYRPLLSHFARRKAALKVLSGYSQDQRKALLTRAHLDAFKSPSQLKGSSRGSKAKGAKTKSQSGTESNASPKAKR
jgi:pimeloyl-ACP methyl ester carboxylesterase